MLSAVPDDGAAGPEKLANKLVAADLAILLCPGAAV